MVDMKIINFELDSRLPANLEPIVAAIGFFDGLHKGHQKLVEEVLKQANSQELTPALITFDPSPKSVLTNNPEKTLSTISERIETAKELGLELVIVIRFSKKLSKLSPDLFYERIIKVLNIKHMVCGEDFRYGHKGSGSVKTLKEIRSLGLSVVEDYKYKGERVSSTRIKNLLSSGRVDLAKKMLNKPYELSGFVMHGRKKGRTIGFPTLNLSVEKYKILPADGVYLGVSTIRGKNYVSTINIGHNPTINTVEKKSIESFVHNYNADTYGEKVTLKIIKKLRVEIKFDEVEALIEQMHKDIAQSELYFNNDRRRLYNIEPI